MNIRYPIHEIIIQNHTAQQTKTNAASMSDEHSSKCKTTEAGKDYMKLLRHVCKIK